jgi:hypothetical protein
MLLESNYRPKPRVSPGQKRCRQEVNTAFSENTIAADPAISIFEKAGVLLPKKSNTNG